MRLSLKFSLVFLLVFVGAFLILNLATDNVAAIDYWWDNGGADGKASTAANWNPDLPGVAGWTSVDNLTWGAVSVSNCAFDSANTAYKWTILANYSGTITQGSNDINIGAGGFSMAGPGPTFTPLLARKTYCSGNVLNGGGMVTGNVWNLVMNGIVQSATGLPSYMGSLRVQTGQTTLLSNTDIYSGTNLGIVVDADATLILNTGVVFGYSYYDAGDTISNAGVISGQGTLKINVYLIDKTADFGIISCPLQVLKIGAGAFSPTLTLLASPSLGTLLVQSNMAGQTMTLDLNGKSLSSGPITVGTRGIISSSVAGAEIDAGSILVQANGQLDATNIAYINCAGNWDTSAGTWTPGTGQVNMTATGSTKLGAVQTFYNLIISSGVTRTLLSNVEISSFKDMNGTLVQGAYVVTISGTSANPARLNGTWSGVINITSSGATYTIYAGNSWTGTIQASKPMTIIFPGGQLVIIPPEDKWYNITMKGWTGPNAYKWFASSTTANANLTFEASGLINNGRYDVYLDDEFDTYKIASGAGVVTYYHASWSGHFITLKSKLIITSGPAQTSVAEDNPYYYNATADEECTWAIDTLHTWLTISEDGKITGTPSNLHVAVYTVSLIADNENGTVYYNWTLTVTNIAVIILNPITNDTQYSLVNYYYDVNSTDEGYGAVYSLATSYSSITIDPETGVISGYLDRPMNITLEVIVNDGHGGTDSFAFYIVVGAPNIRGLVNPLIFGIAAIMMIGISLAYLFRMMGSGSKKP